MIFYESRPSQSENCTQKTAFTCVRASSSNSIGLQLAYSPSRATTASVVSLVQVRTPSHWFLQPVSLPAAVASLFHSVANSSRLSQCGVLNLKPAITTSLRSVGVGDLRSRLQITQGRELFVRVQVDVELYESERGTAEP